MYIEYLREKNFSNRTKLAHRSLMAYALDTIGSKPLNSLTYKDLENVKRHFLAKEGIAPATVRAHLSVLRTVVYYAKRKGYCADLIFPVIPNPRYKKLVPPTMEELSKMHAAAAPHIKS